MVPLPVVKSSSFVDNCPISRYHHFHTYSGSGQQFMALAVAEGRSKPDAAAANVAFSCRSCGYCEVACKFIMDVDRHKINVAFREYLVRSGLSPTDHINAVENLKTSGSINENPKRPPGAWANGLDLKILPEQKAPVPLWAGCIQRDDDRAAETANKLARLLLKAGVDVGILSDREPCCGLPAYWRGYGDDFTEMVSKNTDLLNKLGVKTIVTASGSCLGSFRNIYRQYVNAPEPQVLHATEYLLQLVKRRKLRLKHPVKATVTYHDPCYLGRQSQPDAEWQGEEKKAFGQLVYWDPNEMHRIREYAFCCGAGGGITDDTMDMARQTALHRMDEAIDVGAQSLVTACSHCQNHFTQSLKDSDVDHKITITDVIDIVAQSVGIEPLS
jgi:Fe-S oxidoreductase